MSDLISRQDAINAIHTYWKKRLETLPTKMTENGEVYADIQSMDRILEHNKTLVHFIEALPSVKPAHSTDEWCQDCKEYDKENHCCPRFNHVIRTTLAEAKEGDTDA